MPAIRCQGDGAERLERHQQQRRWKSPASRDALHPRPARPKPASATRSAPSMRKRSARLCPRRCSICSASWTEQGRWRKVEPDAPPIFSRGMTSAPDPRPAPAREAAAIGPAGRPAEPGQPSSMRWFARLPTTVKLITLMLLALAPLMVIAVLALGGDGAHQPRHPHGGEHGAGSGERAADRYSRRAHGADAARIRHGAGHGAGRGLHAARWRRWRPPIGCAWISRCVIGTAGLSCATRGYRPDGAPVVTGSPATIRITPRWPVADGNDACRRRADDRRGARFSQATVAATARPRIAEGPYRLVLRDRRPCHGARRNGSGTGRRRDRRRAGGGRRGPAGTDPARPPADRERDIGCVAAGWRC